MVYCTQLININFLFTHNRHTCNVCQCAFYLNMHRVCCYPGCLLHSLTFQKNSFTYCHKATNSTLLKPVSHCLLLLLLLPLHLSYNAVYLPGWRMPLKANYIPVGLSHPEYCCLSFYEQIPLPMWPRCQRWLSL